MPGTNVELSENELKLVTNSEFILTKNRIIEKVYTMFGSLSEVYKIELDKYAAILTYEIFSTTPKIYKGENYLSLPYVMMDHPRVFFKEDVFAIRSFFWWGNYFSLTLQLSGKFLQVFKNNIGKNLKKHIEAGYFICTNDSQWEHHFEETNYRPLYAMDSIEEILNKPFIKIAKQHKLSQWNSAATFFERNYAEMIRLVI